MRSKAGRVIAGFAFEADQAAEENGTEKAGEDDGVVDAGFGNISARTRSMEAVLQR